MKDLIILGYDFSDWSEEMFNEFMNCGWHYWGDNDEYIEFEGKTPRDFADWINEHSGIRKNRSYWSCSW